MNALMRSEILDQPDALRQCLPSLRSQLRDIFPLSKELRQIYFTGSGDSYFASLAFQYAAYRYVTGSVQVLPALEGARYRRFISADLVIAISISGESYFTVAAAQAAREAGAFVIAITTDETSSLAQTSHERLVLPFRSRSRKTPHTTDYLTTLLAVAAILEVLGGHSVSTLDTLPEAVAQSLEILAGPCQDIGEALVSCEQFYFLGSGPHFANAQYGAAKFWEAGGLSAHAFELEEFTHGPHLLLAPDDPVFIISPDGQSIDRAVGLVKGLQGIGTRVFAITDVPNAFSDIRVLQTPSLAEEWSPFVTCLPLQWLCWAVATSKGYDVVRKDSLRANPESYEALRWPGDRGMDTN